MTTTLSGIAEELEQRAGAAQSRAIDASNDYTCTQLSGMCIAYREAATLIRTADDREKVLREAVKTLRDGYDDAVAGLRYIEVHYGKLGGVGWQRVYDAFEVAVTIPEREGLLAGGNSRQALGGTNA